jgi:hypothetical protein
MDNKWNGLKRTPLKRKPYKIKQVSNKQLKRNRKLSQIKPPGNGLCQNCKKLPDFRGLAKHHKVFRSQLGNDDYDNILWVCGKCHSRFHGITER